LNKVFLIEYSSSPVSFQSQPLLNHYTLNVEVVEDMAL